MIIVILIACCLLTADSFINSWTFRSLKKTSPTTSIITRYIATPKRRREDDEYPYISKYNENQDKRDDRNNVQKSNESNFWYSVKNKSSTRQEDVIPYQPILDDDGPLPFGSYKQLGNREYQSKRICALSIALDFWNSRLNSDTEMDMSSVIQNVHTLIDSGFTSFQLFNDDHRISTSSIANINMEPSWKQTFIEQNVYHKVVKETPTSVLNECNLSTRISVPKLIREGNYQSNYISDETVFAFREGAVRQNIGQSIKNIFGQANGCLDSVQVTYQYDDKYNISPYTFDILSVLIDMQKEGLIRSINGLNFPSSAILELEKNGFDLDYNQITSNLLESSNYIDHLRHMNLYQNYNRPVLVSSPLAGGLLTNRFANIPSSFLNRKGSPVDNYFYPSEKSSFNNLFVQSWIPKHTRKNDNQINHPWNIFTKEIMRVLEDIALKHQVSLATVVLRWSMQLDHVSSVVIGSSLNTKLGNNDHLFTRQKDLRQVFALHLDEEDMTRLFEIFFSCDQEIHGFTEEDIIDFDNTNLWL